MRWPSRSGLAVPIQELGFREVPPERGRTNNHHLYFERQKYRDIRWRSVFRNLVDHVVTMEVPEHNDLHRRFTSPKIPADTLMLEVLQDYMDEHGAIDCVREHKTHEVYQIQSGEWEFIKGLYRRAA